MGKVTIPNQPCLSPDCGSSDARQIYEDGSSFCFSCQTMFKPGDEEKFENVKISSEKIKVSDNWQLEEIETYPTRGFPERKISKKKLPISLELKLLMMLVQEM